MVLDTSAIVVILMAEFESSIFTDIIAAQTKLAISPVTFHETSIVMAGKKRRTSAARLVDDFVHDLAVDVSVVTINEALAARDVYFKYGRGYHPAALNLADCFAYGLAKLRNEPLLFKGDDFSKTDIVPAWRP